MAAVFRAVPVLYDRGRQKTVAFREARMLT